MPKARNFKKFFKVITHNLFPQYFLSYFLITSGLTMIVLAFGSTLLSELKYYKDKITGTEYVLAGTKTEEPKGLEKLIDHQVELAPVSEEFSIVIEKIGVNAPIIKNVSVTDEQEYFEALKKGVAHAKGKGLPGQPGNIFLFAHSSIEFWKMGPYATVFNQLRRLEMQDEIYVIYNGERYRYKVFDKEVVKSFDTSPYEKDYNLGSVLTLQTCDPPGTTLNRLIIRAYPAY